MADNVAVTAGSGTSIAADEAVDATLGTVKFQYVKLVDGTLDGTNKIGGSTSFGLMVDVTRIKGPTIATITSVTGSTTAVTVLASNANRVTATVFNDSTANLYLALNSFASASTTAFTVKLASGAYYEVPAGFVGTLSGIWDAVNGAARVTEFTP